MTLRELYNAIGNSRLSQDDQVVVIESELGVTLEIVAPTVSPVRVPASGSAPVSTPLKKSEDDDTDG